MDKSKKHWERVQEKKKRDKEIESKILDDFCKHMDSIVEGANFICNSVFKEDNK